MEIREFQILLEDTKAGLRRRLLDKRCVNYDTYGIKVLLTNAYKKLTNEFEEQTFIENMKEVWDWYLDTQIVGA
jgi:hypothetical protein